MFRLDTLWTNEAKVWGRTKAFSQNISKVSSYQVKLSRKRTFHHFMSTRPTDTLRSVWCTSAWCIQWFSECQMSRFFNKHIGRCQHHIFPLKISFGGRYFPTNEDPNIADIWRLSSELVMGIIFSPARCMQLGQVEHWFGPSWQLIWNAWAV